MVKYAPLISRLLPEVEAQGKFVQETMKNYLALIEVVDKLRSMEEAKVEVRGKGELSGAAAEFLANRK